MRHEHYSRSPFIRACSNLICIYFESIESIEIAIHSILSILNRLLSEINNSRFKNPCFKIDAYASSGFVIDASRKRVNRYTPSFLPSPPTLRPKSFWACFSRRSPA